jgi:hypothetical protein
MYRKRSLQFCMRPCPSCSFIAHTDLLFQISHCIVINCLLIIPRIEKHVNGNEFTKRGGTPAFHDLHFCHKDMTMLLQRAISFIILRRHLQPKEVATRSTTEYEKLPMPGHCSYLTVQYFRTGTAVSAVFKILL